MSGFLETPRFPDDLAVWAMGGVGFNTVVSQSASGREQRNILWQYGRGRWDLQNCFRKNGQAADALTVQYLRNFFRYVKGQAYGFRFRDWTDYQDEGYGVLGPLVTSLTTPVVPNGGAGTPQMQMFKQYAAAPFADYRIIQKPDARTALTVLRGGVPMVVGTSAGQYQLDTTTGIVQFTADNSAAITGWTPGASTQFTVGAVPSGWVVGTTVVYITGATGTGASLLNNTAQLITAIAGTTITLGSANTTGLTLSGGTAAKYPQPNEAMTWTGNFDTPVRFATDQFSPQLDVGSGALYGLQTLQLVEIRI